MATVTYDHLITALFHSRQDADRAYEALRERGYTTDDISVMMAEDTREHYYGDEHTEIVEGSKAAEGAGIGGAVGGTIGGVLGAIAAAAAPVVFPGIGIVLSGPLAAALAGAGAGGLGGSVLGGLIGAGIPEERIKHYERGIKEEEGILLAVDAKSQADADYIETLFNKYGGTQIHR
jgi:hypothetical protein